jgi:hypothetical protein
MLLETYDTMMCEPDGLFCGDAMVFFNLSLLIGISSREIAPRLLEGRGAFRTREQRNTSILVSTLVGMESVC